MKYVLKSLIEELEYNREINILKGLENRVDIDYILERLNEILDVAEAEIYEEN